MRSKSAHWAKNYTTACVCSPHTSRPSALGSIAPWSPITKPWARWRAGCWYQHASSPSWARQWLKTFQNSSLLKPLRGRFHLTGMRTLRRKRQKTNGKQPAKKKNPRSPNPSPVNKELISENVYPAPHLTDLCAKCVSIVDEGSWPLLHYRA